MEKITLFEKGKDIREGDKLIAHVDSVEGHRRVNLIKLEEKKGSKPSVIVGLIQMSKALDDIINYEQEVSEDMTDAIEYSKLKDKVDQKIRELQS